MLLYHVAEGGRRFFELRAEGEVTTLQGGTVTVDGRHLVDADPDLEDPALIGELKNIEANNGVIQGIDRVLLPVDFEEAVPQPSIADLVVATSGASGFDHDGGDFDLLREALIATDLLGAVADRDADLTVFAPTDAAFGELAVSLGFTGHIDDEAAVFGFLADATGFVSAEEPGLLGDILLYHVAEVGRSLAQLQADEVIATLGGETVKVDGRELIDAEPDLVNPEVIAGRGNIEAANGVVQAIDGVLLPLDLGSDTLIG